MCVNIGLWSVENLKTYSDAIEPTPHCDAADSESHRKHRRATMYSVGDGLQAGFPMRCAFRGIIMTVMTSNNLVEI